jgi:hypothetical protein
MSASGACEPVHHESIGVGTDELGVFRCSWGWCVKRSGVPYRARTLLEAFEAACGGRVDAPVLRKVVGVIERALDAEYALSKETVSTVVAVPETGVDSVAAR